MLHVVRARSAAYAAAAAALLTLASAPVAAAAQEACKIDYNKPNEVKNLYLAIDFKKDRKSITDAMRSLTSKWDKVQNLPAAHLMVGQALMWHATQPGATATVRRGDVGFATMPDQTIDLYAEMERAAAEVERLAPGCGSETEMIRRVVLQRALNQSVDYINFQSTDQAMVRAKMDTARTLLDRAIRVMPTLPYGHYYLSFVARRMNDTTAERAALRKVIELTPKDAIAKDTSLATTRRDALINLGMSFYTQAQTASEAQRAAPAGEAVGILRTLLAEYPNDPEAAKVQNVLNSSLSLSGDTAATARVHDDMLANPAKYGDDQLVTTGMQLFNGGKGSTERALRFFEAALVVNPNQRDALNNSLNLYYRLKQFDRITTVGPRFLTIEPNLASTWQMIGYAYQEMAKAEKDVARKKTLNDSAKKYIDGSNKLPVTIDIQQLAYDGTKYSVSGTAENATPGAKNTKVRFEFLDKSGKVVASEEAPLNLGNGGSAKFKVEVSGSGIAGYRYQPIM